MRRVQELGEMCRVSMKEEVLTPDSGFLFCANTVRSALCRFLRSLSHVIAREQEGEEALKCSVAQCVALCATLLLTSSSFRLLLFP